MREERVIALAGLFQAVALVRTVAVRGGADPFAMQPSLASIFKIDADSPADVFGGVGNLRPGLETLIAQLDSDKRDLSVQFCHLAFAFRRIDVRTSPTRSPLRQDSFCVG